jgi:hypothetical protein
VRVFENRVLRRIVGPKRDEITEEWRKLHTEDLNDMYSPNIIHVISGADGRIIFRLIFRKWDGA